MAPNMASGRYGIFAKITVIEPRGKRTRQSTLASKGKAIRVIPIADEQPPLDVRKEAGEYVMRREKTIRKGALRSNFGTLVMQAAQPQSVRVGPDNEWESRRVTVATVILRFDPTDENSLPPKLDSLMSKLKIMKFFASNPHCTFPTKHASLIDSSQAWHTKQLNPSSRCIAHVQWTKQDPSGSPTMERRDSANSTLSPCTGMITQPSESDKGKSYYVVRLRVPIILPRNKAFVPTFHSCFISRLYALKLDLASIRMALAQAWSWKSQSKSRRTQSFMTSSSSRSRSILLIK